MKIWTLLSAPARQYEAAFAECAIPETKPSSSASSSSGEGEAESQRGLDPEKRQEKLIVSFEDTPEANPRNWSLRKKVILTLQVTLIALQVTFASSVSSAAAVGQQESFHISQAASSLSTAVFLWGTACGGIPLPALSELLGRQRIYVFTLLLTNLFEIGAALSGHIYTTVICRFLAGFCASAPLSVAGGTVVDIWTDEDRAWAFPAYAAASFIGPNAGPLIAGYLAMNVSWRWAYHITYIIGLPLTLYCFCFCYESLPDEILRQKAKYLRQRTGDPRWSAPKEHVPLGKLFKTAFTKVIIMFFTEPLVTFTTIYLSIVYFCLFGDLESYTIIFGEQHGFNTGEVGLAFLPTIIGIVLSFPIMFYLGLRFRRKAKRLGRVPSPEQHLIPMLIGGPILSIGLLWLAFTSPANVNEWAPLMSGVPFGLGIMLVFIASYMCIIASYGSNAASALGALVFIRYLVSGGAVMATTPMLRAMTTRWGEFMLALVSIALIPASVLFYYKGPSIRRRSPYAIKGDLDMQD